MLMIAKAAPRRVRSSRLESLRVQAAIGFLFAVLVPVTIRYQTLQLYAIDLPSFTDTFIGATIANLLGLILYRRFAAFPGTHVYGNILPSYATSFGLVLAGFFILRLKYSRFDFIASFVVALLAAYALSFYLERRTVRRFYVVPFGHVRLPDSQSGIEWITMTEPSVPNDPHAVIVADLRFDHDAAWERMLAEAAVQGHSVFHIKQLRESLTGRVSIEHLSENSFGSLIPNLAYRKVKRLLELVVCIALLPLIIIPMVLIAIVIRLDSKGSPLFRQERMGYRGRPFTMIKFRTMAHRAPGEGNGEDARVGATTMSNDARITRVGRLLRQTRLDELPQLINVLRGEMSWIGPRPEAVPLSEWYEAELPFYFYRHIVRPGITGWAQVNQGHVADLEAVHMKLKYDFYYIKNFSGWLDVLIALRTVRIMLTGFGAK